jgi:hypothetical protein
MKSLSIQEITEFGDLLTHEADAKGAGRQPYTAECVVHGGPQIVFLKTADPSTGRRGRCPSANFILLLLTGR